MAQSITSQPNINMWEIVTTVLAYIIAPLVLLLMIPLVLVVLVQREILKWHLRWRYQTRFTVMTPLDSMTSLETPPKVVGYTTCLLVETCAPFDEKKLVNLRAKISTMLNTQMYRKLKYRQCTKWGYNCWEDMGLEKNGFNITHHVNPCPAADDWNKVYSETEMMAAVKARINFDLDAQNKPAWEVLVVPQVKIKSEILRAASKSQSALIIRINHGYMDAKSFKEFLKRCLFDNEIKPLLVAKKSGGIDSFRLFWSGVSLWYTTVLNIRESLRHRKHVIPTMGSSNSYRLAYIKIDGSTMSRIRAAFKSETLAVFCSALMASLNELACRRRCVFPNSLNVALTTTVDHQPTSDEPGNLFNLYFRCLPCHGSNPQSILKTVNNQIFLKPTDSLELSGNFVQFLLLGCLPATWTRTLFKFLEFRSIVLSTLPMAEQVYQFQGGEVTSFFCTLPPIAGVSSTLTSVFYRGIFHVGIGALDNQLITNYRDIDELTEHFQRYIQRLEKLSMVKDTS